MNVITLCKKTILCQFLSLTKFSCENKEKKSSYYLIFQVVYFIYCLQWILYQKDVGNILETLWFSGFILAKGCVDIAGIALRYPKTKMPLVYHNLALPDASQ